MYLPMSSCRIFHMSCMIIFLSLFITLLIQVNAVTRDERVRNS